MTHRNLALFALLVVITSSGCSCSGTAGWRQVASTVEVGVGHTDHAADDSLGNPLYSDSTQVWVTVHPLAFLAPPTQVVIVNKGGK